MKHIADNVLSFSVERIKEAAANGSTVKVLKNHSEENPAVKEAWEKYRLTLKLSMEAESNGR